MLRKLFCFYIYLFLYIYIVQYSVYGDISKSSLTFVIDDTGSMLNEINQVKVKTKLIFDAVLESNGSNVDDFILVTFNDPGTKVRAITRDQNEFKRALDGINVDGGGDCPEYAMTGIELALEKSKPNSYLYVYTDAAAKDYNLFERVKSLSIKKSTKVTFLLTGECSDNDPIVYDKLAVATSGQVFHIEKQDVNKIIDYIIESVKHVKTTLRLKSITKDSGRQMQFNVDSKVWDIIVSVSAANPKFHVIGPDGNIVETLKEKSITTRRTKIDHLNLKPGVYDIVLDTDSPTSVVVTGSTTVTLNHGFSTLEPANLNETATKPILDEKSYLAIKLNNYKKDVILKVVELQDLDDNIIKKLSLKLINEEDQLYVTESFLPPNRGFKLIVTGYTTEGEEIIRLGTTTIEAQDVELEGKIEDKLPTITIVNGHKIEAEYGKPLNIKCKIYAYPKPDVIWQDSMGFTWSSKAVPIDLPYDYISVLNIDKANKNSTYTCKAVNTKGVSKASIAVVTKDKTFLNILNRPVDTTIGYGEEFTFKIIVDTYPPANITWFKSLIPITHDDNYNLSKDISTSILTIKNMNFTQIGQYSVQVYNGYQNENIFFNVSIHAELPKVNKSIHSLTFKDGSTAVIKCNVARGYPEPKISWSFKYDSTAKVIKLDKVNDTIVINNVTKAITGIYVCTAYNKLGRDSHDIDVLIEYPPTIDKEAEIVRAVEGDRIKLTCYADGAPSPVIKWFENNIEITSTGRHHIYEGKILRFKAHLRSHGSIYACEARNALGKARKSFQINIYSPTYIQSPVETELNVDIGNPLSLSCIAYGFPKPEVHWTFYSSSSDKLKSLRTDETNAIEIDRVQFENEGIYTCMANNSLEPVYLTYEVHVTAVPSIVNTLIDKSLKGVVGDLVLRIPCKAIGSPKPTITWTKNDNNIAVGTDWSDVAEDGTLIIKNLDKSAKGIYKCKAENKLGLATEVFNVNVQDYPDTGGSTINVLLDEGASANIDCDLPHDKKDLVRWFKDGRVIAVGKFILLNAKLSDSGIYTCRVSTFMHSDSSHKNITVGRKPQFSTDEETEIDYKEGSTVFLGCDANSDTDPEVYWYHNGRELNESLMKIILEMTSSAIGNYTCKVSNMFGEITRTFNINRHECILNIENDFYSKQPLILTQGRQWYPFKNDDGIITIPTGYTLLLTCPMSHVTDKKNRFTETVSAKCVEKSTFRIHNKLVDFKDLLCLKENRPVAKKESDSCGQVNENTKLVNVGFNIRSKLLGVYYVCIDVVKKVPVFAKHTMSPSFANVIPKDFMNSNFSKSNYLPFEFDFMYDCKNQTSTVISPRTSIVDSCCYKKRQLINPKDILPGLPQLAAYSYLNVVPHWSSCGTKNWNEVEERVRNLVQSLDEDLEIWTGSSHTLDSYDEYKYLTDTHDRQPISPYIWKVLYNPKVNEAVAIIQMSIENLTSLEAIKKIPCHDICYTIEWMKNLKWYDVNKGFTVCCDVQEFQTVFGFNFTNATRVLSQNVIPKYALLH